MTLRFKCNVDNEYHGYENPFDMQDVLSTVAGQNLGAMKKAGASQADMAKHLRIVTAITATLLAL